MTTAMLVLGLAASTACGSSEGSPPTSDVDPAAAESVTGTAESGAGTAESGAEPATTDARGDGAPAGVGDPVGFADHLSVGDCWNDTLDADGDFVYVGSPDLVDCDQPHDNEVTAVWLVDDGPHRGDDAIEAQSEEVCGAAFDRFVGAAYEDTAVDGFAVWPDEPEWEQGARQAACSVYLPDARVRGSLEGVGLHPRPHDYPAPSPIPPSAVLQLTGVTDEGDRLVSFDEAMDRDRAADAIVAAAADIGWTLDARAGASRTVVLEFSDDGTEYTIAVTAPEDADEPTSIAYYYPADPDDV